MRPPRTRSTLDGPAARALHQALRMVLTAVNGTGTCRRRPLAVPHGAGVRFQAFRAASSGTEHKRSYLDHNATTPVRPAVAEAMLRALQMPGNPSSVHSEGRAARGAIEQAREQVAALVGAKASNVVFASG
eukprot:gene28455-36702_t